MGSGKSWNLTDKRLKETIQRLEEQDTLTNIARSYGVQLETLSNKLRELGYDYKEIRKDGITSFKRRMMIAVEQVDETDKMVKLGLEFLKMYDSETVAKKVDVETTEVPAVTFSEIGK